MRGALILAAALALPTAARADDTFEQKAGNAPHLHHLDDIVWPLTAPCDQGDDTQQRECRHVRDARAKELAGALVVIDGDAATFEIGAWSPAKKSLAVHLAGGDLRAAPLYDNAKGFADEAAANTWKAAAANARVQLLVRVPAKWPAKARAASALGVEVVGWRVYAACTGAIVIASPNSAAVAADKAACKVAKPTVQRPAPTAPSTGAPIDDLK